MDLTFEEFMQKVYYRIIIFIRKLNISLNCAILLIFFMILWLWMCDQDNRIVLAIPPTVSMYIIFYHFIK